MEMTIDEIATRKQDNLIYNIASTDKIIEILEQKKNYKKIAFNLEIFGRSAIELGMLYSRVYEDDNKACDVFNKSLDVLDDFFTIEIDNVDPSNFEFPVYCCLLANQLDKAKALSKVLCSMPISAHPNWFEMSARLLAAFVLGDIDFFKKFLSVYETIDLIYLQKKLGVYLEIYQAVIESDVTRYNELMLEVSESFEERATDKQFGDSAIYGGLYENDYVLDFMSLGIAVVADSKGMKIDIDTQYFPTALYHLILQS